MFSRKGIIFVVSAPSGAGKTTLCQRLCSMDSGIKHSVSYTTRKPRPGEINDIHYTFIDEDEFRAMISEGDFVEWASVHGNLYGTSKRRIAHMVDSGIDVILDIDVQGARQIRSFFPDSVSLFILPPSMDVLKERLSGRMSDSPKVIAARIKKATDEIMEYENYSYVIVNDALDKALAELKAVVTAERIKTFRTDHRWIKENFGNVKSCMKEYFKTY